MPAIFDFAEDREKEMSALVIGSAIVITHISIYFKCTLVPQKKCVKVNIDVSINERFDFNLLCCGNFKHLCFRIKTMSMSVSSKWFTTKSDSMDENFKIVFIC